MICSTAPIVHAISLHHRCSGHHSAPSRTAGLSVALVFGCLNEPRRMFAIGVSGLCGQHSWISTCMRVMQARIPRSAAASSQAAITCAGRQNPRAPACLHFQQPARHTGPCVWHHPQHQPVQKCCRMTGTQQPVRVSRTLSAEAGADMRGVGALPGVVPGPRQLRLSAVPGADCRWPGIAAAAAAAAAGGGEWTLRTGPCSRDCNTLLNCMQSVAGARRVCTGFCRCRTLV
jgi:hypothetical protein